MKQLKISNLEIFKLTIASFIKKNKKKIWTFISLLLNFILIIWIINTYAEKNKLEKQLINNYKNANQQILYLQSAYEQDINILKNNIQKIKIYNDSLTIKTKYFTYIFLSAMHKLNTSLTTEEQYIKQQLNLQKKMLKNQQAYTSELKKINKIYEKWIIKYKNLQLDRIDSIVDSIYQVSMKIASQ